MRRATHARLVAALAALAVCGAPAVAPAQDVAVRGEIVHTMAGPAIQDGVVLVQGGRITAVGPAADVALPPGIELLRARVVTPGLVDAHATVGLAGYLNQDGDRDELDRSSPIQPELRALDGYNPRERLIDWVAGFGVTTVHTGHAPGALVSGQTLVAKTRGNTVDEAVFVPRAMLACTLGEGAQTGEEGKAPATRSKAVAMLRAELIRAQEYAGKRGLEDESKRPERDLRLETLADVLAGELPLLVTVQRHQDIVSALRLAREFGLSIVLDGAAEAPDVADEIALAGVPVFVHPPMARGWGELENASMTTAARLRDAGIPIALQSGYEDYVPRTRVLLYEAAVAAAHGLGSQAALAAVTIDAARLIGVADRVGSLEVGKHGDLALYDGDPFEYTSHCVGVVIEGEVVSRGSR
jgi:imidazolonepropionase-like amidohydrolase